MKILVTGADGFIAKNLIVYLKERDYNDIMCYTRGCDLAAMANEADFVFHLAGVNRPNHVSEFDEGNVDVTASLINALTRANNNAPIVLASSIQADLDNPYGKSKAAAERAVLKYQADTFSKVYVYRLPNVFGKWCKPNYNSVIATFCYNLVNDLPISIKDANSPLNLVYIDDVCSSFINILDAPVNPGFVDIDPIYQTTVGQVATILQKFKLSRDQLLTDDVGQGLIRALYSTFLSYYRPGQFSYIVPSYTDSRGTFVEMLKTHNAGQFSFFTAHPGVTRGGHYHHSKNEKFLIIKGTSRFRFKHIMSGEFYEQTIEASDYTIIETVPGWSHDITNIGDDELIVMLWANEIFDRDKPDTYVSLL